MSCNSCNKFGCTCTDNALTTPCSYTDCSDPAAEPCESVQCLKCVSNCGTAFSAELLSGTITFKVEKGERLRDTLQNLLLYLKDAACLATAPSNLAASGLTASTITLTWELTTAAAVDVEYKAVSSGGWTVAQAAVNGTTFQITNLLANTAYAFRVTNGACESVDIYATTL